MNTIQLECFIAVAEHLNFSRASEKLKITQPAVSHQIRTLEEELNVKLFKRTSKNVSLTPEGVRFLPDAELILKTAVSAKERLGRKENFIVFEVGCHNHMELNLLHPEPDPLPSGTGAAILYREHRKLIHTRQSRARVCPLSGYSPPPGTGAAVCPCHRTSKPALRSLLPV